MRAMPEHLTQTRHVRVLWGCRETHPPLLKSLFGHVQAPCPVSSRCMGLPMPQLRSGVGANPPGPSQPAQGSCSCKPPSSSWDRPARCQTDSGNPETPQDVEQNHLPGPQGPLPLLELQARRLLLGQFVGVQDEPPPALGCPTAARHRTPHGPLWSQGQPGSSFPFIKS